MPKKIYNAVKEKIHSFEPGEKVLAKWSDGKYYDAVILIKIDHKYRILYSKYDHREDISCEKIKKKKSPTPNDQHQQKSMPKAEKKSWASQQQEFDAQSQEKKYQQKDEKKKDIRKNAPIITITAATTTTTVTEDIKVNKSMPINKRMKLKYWNKYHQIKQREGRPWYKVEQNWQIQQGIRNPPSNKNKVSKNCRSTPG